MSKADKYVLVNELTSNTNNPRRAPVKSVSY
jgi:hypothetical protein